MLFFAFALSCALPLERCSSADDVCLLQLRSNTDTEPIAQLKSNTDSSLEGHTVKDGPEEFLTWFDDGMQPDEIPVWPCTLATADCRDWLLRMAKEHACNKEGLSAEDEADQDEYGGMSNEDRKFEADEEEKTAETAAALQLQASAADHTDLASKTTESS